MLGDIWNCTLPYNWLLNRNKTSGSQCEMRVSHLLFHYSFFAGLFHKRTKRTTKGYSARLDFKKRNAKRRCHSAEILSPAKHKRRSGRCNQGIQLPLTWIAMRSFCEGLTLWDLSSSFILSILLYLESLFGRKCVQWRYPSRFPL